jgi:metal-responsive CopG/Arc/MetJ family transcriptional regulator
MLRPLANHKIIIGICLPESLKEEIDKRREDVPRSKFISRILERQLVHESELENQRNVGLNQDKVPLIP